MKFKPEASNHDHHFGWSKGKRDYTSDKHKSKGRFDKEVLK
jgi:Ulp1 family protease